MDPHFREYLAAVCGMQDVYGFNDDHADVAQADAGMEVGLRGQPTVAEAIPAVAGCR